MREVIQQLVAAEAEAQRIVQAAHAEADRILVETQRQAQECVARGREETRVTAELLIAAALAEAGRDKQVRLAQAGHEIEAQVRLDDSTQEQIIAEIVRCVTCGT
jgi:cell division septum initiation protein DivIVA